MKYTLRLRRHEYNTLMILLESVLFNSQGQRREMTAKLYETQLLRIYQKLFKRSLTVKDKNAVILQPDEAMAFHIYWRSTPVANIITSALINRIIGEIDKLYS